MRILFEDGHLLAVDKPAGTLVVPSPSTPASETLLAQARSHVGARVWALHRLDRDTSGVLIFGKTPEACRAFHQQFEARAIEKCYDAIVQGRVAQGRRVITLPLAKRRWARAGIRKGGDPARTEYEVKERCGPVTWLKVMTRTGRFHQVRVHLSAIGHPLAYDPLYHKGGPWPWLGRVPFHAGSISFAHPATGERMTLTCPLPEDFERALRRFRKLPSGAVPVETDA